MKTAISIPDPLFRAAERAAHRRGISRSRLYALAIEAFLKEQQHDDVKEALTRLYSVEDSRLDPILEALQFASIPREEW